MEDITCLECGESTRKIGQEVFYCDECDKIITAEKILV